ncbi:hypothetical protein ACFYNO_17435 [Kitasatospora sp. NPDC006697]|uniref:hypothetical protein n=1 Tax=Kitasatospora sp. NPDC006697 TaxID=3364020 RepID=UPI00369CAC22
MRIPISLRAAALAAAATGLLVACGAPPETLTAPRHLAAPTPVPTAMPSAPRSTAPTPTDAPLPADSDSPTAAPSLSPAAAQAGAQLMASVLPVPAGGHGWPDETGLLDQAGFVKEVFAPDAQQTENTELTKRKFTVAAQRGWRDKDDNQAHVLLVKFATASGAKGLYDGITANWQDQQGQADKGTVFQDQADQATGHVITKLDSLGNAYVTMIATQGDTVVYLRYFTAAHPDQTGTQAMLHRQLALLNNPAAPPGI